MSACLPDNFNLLLHGFWIVYHQFTYPFPKIPNFSTPQIFLLDLTSVMLLLYHLQFLRRHLTPMEHMDYKI